MNFTFFSSLYSLFSYSFLHQHSQERAIESTKHQDGKQSNLHSHHQAILTHITGKVNRMQARKAGRHCRSPAEITRLLEPQRSREANPFGRLHQWHADQRYNHHLISYHHLPHLLTLHRLHPMPPRREPHLLRKDRLRKLVLVLRLHRQTQASESPRRRPIRQRQDPQHRRGAPRQAEREVRRPRGR